MYFRYVRISSVPATHAYLPAQLAVPRLAGHTRSPIMCTPQLLSVFNLPTVCTSSRLLRRGSSLDTYYHVLYIEFNIGPFGDHIQTRNPGEAARAGLAFAVPIWNPMRRYPVALQIGHTHSAIISENPSPNASDSNVSKHLAVPLPTIRLVIP
ncbi:hypothetical protein BD779DRAFT_804896 [Infundibulicybe gibba]|nr:hypothetical protein BD779DRAFT_804896 [Infundibulicybe gibba]